MTAFAGDSELTAVAAARGPRPLAPARARSTFRSARSRASGRSSPRPRREAGIATLGDLLLRFPHSHRDRTVVPVAELEPGDSGTVEVEVLGNAPRPFRRRGLSITSVKVGDDSGSLRATWFNQPWVAPKLHPGLACC